MKTTLDIPDELASEVKRLAERRGTAADEQLLRILYIVLLLEDLPLGALEVLARRTHTLRTLRKLGYEVADKSPAQGANSLPFTIDPSTGLPVIESPPDAPIHSMTAEQFQDLINEAELEGDLERAGFTAGH